MLSYFRPGLPLDLPTTFPSELDEMIAQYYYEVEKYYKAYFEKNVNASVFGFVEKINYNPILDFHYLLGLYVMAYLEQKDSEGETGCRKTTTAVRDSFELDCVRNYFKCIGFDTKKIDEIFNLNENSLLTGIGYMAIEESGCDTAVFKIS